MLHRVLIQPASYEDISNAVDRAFELFPVEVRGKRVLVKPNALRASEVNEHIVTHPALVRAVVERLQSMGPGEIIVGDNPGMLSYGANERTFAQTGLMEASLGHYRNIGQDAVKVPFDPQFMGEITVSRAVLDADVLISLPKFKTHGLTILTGALKNSYGFIPGALKAKLHRAAGNSLRFSRMMLEVYKIRPPDLIIMDAVVAMEGNGPASSDLKDVGVVLASDNGVALDTAMAVMAGLDPQGLPFLSFAREMGLGDPTPSSLEVIGRLEPIADFRPPPSAQKASELPTGEGEFFDKRIRLRPKADPDRCTSCGQCVEQCPQGALRIEGDLPVVDPDACIACFCCQEMCPEKAMQLG